jgi:outer membrane autotransporter protein
MSRPRFIPLVVAALFLSLCASPSAILAAETAESAVLRVMEPVADGPNIVPDGYYLLLDGGVATTITGEGGAYLETGTVTLGVPNSYAGPTMISGTLRAGADNVLGTTSHLSLHNGGVFDLNGHSQTVGALSGGADATILLGSSAVDPGSLTIAAAYAEVLDPNVVIPMSSETDTISGGTFSGSIGGWGDLTFTGNGASTLGGAHSFTGATIIDGWSLSLAGELSNSAAFVRNEGALQVIGGTIGGGVAVEPGGSLRMESGTIGKNVDVAAGGKLYAGKGGTIGGDLNLAPGSTLVAVLGNSPLVVQGKTAVAQQLNLSVEGTAGGGHSYAVLQAANPADLAGFAPVYRRGPFNEYILANASGTLSLTHRDLDVAALDYTKNQARTYNALMDMPETSPLRAALAAAHSGPLSRKTLNRLSGEAYASLMSGLTRLDMSYARQLSSRISRLSLQHHLADWATGMLAEGDSPDDLQTASGDTYGAVQDDYNVRLSAWVSGGGSWHSASSAGAGHAEMQGPEVTGGINAIFDSGFLYGLSFRYSYKDFDVNSRDTEADVNSYSFAAYAGHEFSLGPGVTRLILGGMYSYHDIDSTRKAHVPGLRQSLEADYDIDTWRVFVEGAYSVAVADAFYVEPFVNLGWSLLQADEFSESGGTAALSAESESENSVSTLLGLRFDLPVNERFTLAADLGWQHIYSGLKPKLGMSFIGSDSFNVKGNRLSRDELVIGFGADFKFTRAISLTLNYDGGIGDQGQTHGGNAALVFRW